MPVDDAAAGVMPVDDAAAGVMPVDDAALAAMGVAFDEIVAGDKFPPTREK